MGFQRHPQHPQTDHKSRLLVICHGFPPYYGGAEHVAYYLTREAVRSGDCEALVVTSDIGGRLPREEQMDGFRVTRLPVRKRAWTRHTALELLGFVLAAGHRLPAALGTFAPDHVLAHFTLPAGSVARRLSRRTGIPYSVVLQGSDVPGYQSRRFGLLYVLVRPWVRAVWRHAHRVIAVSAGLRELALRTWPGGDIRVIGNGVDLERFRPADSDAQNRPTDRLKVVVVAQLIERKGLQFLLDALALMDSSALAGFDVHICGTGPYEPVLRTKAASLGRPEAVHFEGLIAHEALPGLLRSADLFILPTLQEGLPLSLLEAMACGLPVIATGVGGIPAVLRDRENGRVIAPGSAIEIKRALEECLGSVELRRGLGDAARRTAAESGWPAVWKQYTRTMGLQALSRRGAAS